MYYAMRKARNIDAVPLMTSRRICYAVDDDCKDMRYACGARERNAKPLMIAKKMFSAVDDVCENMRYTMRGARKKC